MRQRAAKLIESLASNPPPVPAAEITEALAQAYGVPYARVSPRIADPKAIAAKLLGSRHGDVGIAKE